jgi:hypothetical protein
MKVEIQLTSFNYTTTLKLKTNGDNHGDIPSEWIGVNAINLNSRHFNDYIECIRSCKKLMDDVAEKANANAAGKYEVGTEVNPVHSGQDSISKDWAVYEIARIWIYDKGMKNTGAIQAIGQSRIFGSSPSNTSPLHN